MATSIHPSIPVLSPSFLCHPYIPPFKSKDFSFTCLSIQSARYQIDHNIYYTIIYIETETECTVIMGRDHGHPYIISTTILSDIQCSQFPIIIILMHTYNNYTL